MKITKTTAVPQTASDFVKLRRGIVDHLISGEITWDEYAILLHLIIRANPRTGELLTSYQSLTNETGDHYKKNRINKLMISLKEKQYLYFSVHRGSYKSFKVAINKYPLSKKDDGVNIYLNFIGQNDAVEAELEVNQQNCGERKNDLIKGFSMNDDTS